MLLSSGAISLSRQSFGLFGSYDEGEATDPSGAPAFAFGGVLDCSAEVNHHFASAYLRTAVGSGRAIELAGMGMLERDAFSPIGVPTPWCCSLARFAVDRERRGVGPASTPTSGLDTLLREAEPMSNESDPGELLVKCECGFEARGKEIELVPAVQKHGREAHNMDATPEQVLAMARPVCHTGPATRLGH